MFTNVYKRLLLQGKLVFTDISFYRGVSSPKKGGSDQDAEGRRAGWT